VLNVLSLRLCQNGPIAAVCLSSSELKISEGGL
jgi:hypothetical protein